MRFHHIGIPTEEPREGEYHLADLGIFVVDYRSNPYGVEWMRYEPHCTLPDLVKTVPHVAFVVSNLDVALEGKEILIEPNSPTKGVRVAFIVENGAPIELMELSDNAAHLFPFPNATGK